MSKPGKLFSLLVFLLFISLACSLPAAGNPNRTQPDLGATITAQYISMQASPTTDLAATITAQAAKLESPTPDLAGTITALKVTSTQTPQPAPSTSNPTATGQAAAVPAATDTSTAPSAPGGTTVTVSQETNCRTGPGQAYPSVYVLEPGTTAQVVGKNTYTGYWIINVPNNPGTTCWLYGYYATLNGAAAGLQEYAIPSTPTPVYTATPAGPPAAVSNLKLKTTCNKNSPTSWSGKFTLTWTDNSSDETGFLITDIYPGVKTQIKIAANSTSFNGTWSTTSFPDPTAFTESVQSYNSRGSSAPQTAQGSFICPP